MYKQLSDTLQTQQKQKHKLQQPMYILAQLLFFGTRNVFGLFLSFFPEEKSGVHRAHPVMAVDNDRSIVSGIKQAWREFGESRKREQFAFVDTAKSKFILLAAVDEPEFRIVV